MSNGYCFACWFNSPVIEHHSCDRYERIRRQQSPVEPEPVASVAGILESFGLVHQIHEPALTAVPPRPQFDPNWTREELITLRHLRADWLEGRR